MQYYFWKHSIIKMIADMQPQVCERQVINIIEHTGIKQVKLPIPELWKILFQYSSPVESQLLNANSK